MTPSHVLESLRQLNVRFRTGTTSCRDVPDQRLSSAAGQYPAAVTIGCVDSRAPAEVIFDMGIGDMFSARMAGNVVNDDVLGSLEFACKVAGAKVILLFGHTACGAIKGAIDDVEMGNLTGLLARIKPAISATTFTGEKSSKNAAYVDAVARTNVVLGLESVRRRKRADPGVCEALSGSEVAIRRYVTDVDALHAFDELVRKSGAHAMMLTPPST